MGMYILEKKMKGGILVEKEFIKEIDALIKVLNGNKYTKLKDTVNENWIGHDATKFLNDIEKAKKDLEKNLKKLKKEVKEY